jgi:amino acid transporter
MAEDRYLHPALAKLDAKHGTPALAILIATVASAILATLSLTELIAIYAWLRSATSILTLLALWRLRRRANWKPSFVVPGGRPALIGVIVVPILLFIWALVNSDASARVWGPFTLAIGLVAFAVGGYKKRAAEIPTQAQSTGLNGAPSRSDLSR